MNNVITDPSGIDLYIQRLQTDLYNRLVAKWPNGTVYDCYGKCNRTFKNGNYYAEIYDSTTKDYKDVLFNDNSAIVSFFGTDTMIKNRVNQELNVHLIVMCDLKKLKPSATERAEEKVRIDFLNIIGKALYGFHYRSMESGIDNVLREYRGSANQVKGIDMQPIHAFRINFVIAYKPNFTTTLKLS